MLKRKYMMLVFAIILLLCGCGDANTYEESSDESPVRDNDFLIISTAAIVPAAEEEGIASDKEAVPQETDSSEEGVWFLGADNNSGYQMDHVDEFDYTFYFDGFYLSNDGQDNLIYINPIEVAWEGQERWTEWGHSEDEGGPSYDWRDEDDTLTAVPIKESTEFHMYIHPDVYEEYWGENCDRSRDGEYVTTDPAVFLHFVQTMFGESCADHYVFYMILDEDGSAQYIIDYAWW